MKYPPEQEITIRGKRVTVWVHPPEKDAFAEPETEKRSDHHAQGNP